jgi:hypothetical protein
MERFSTRRFLELILILGIGVGIGAGLDMLLRPTRIIMAAAPVLAAPAPPRIPSPAAPQPAQVANLSCSASATLENNLYPSLMLSFGSLAPEFTHCLTIEIRNAPVGRPCQLRIDSGLLQEPFLVTQNAPSGRFVLNPDIPWNYDTLRQVDQLRPETFVITVTAEDKATAQTSLLCTVHSVNEAVSRVLDPVTGQWQDTSICFAAFVNEDHPWIGTLLKEAASHGNLERFSGYEFGERSVVEQIEAIWEALAARHLTYADLSTSGGVVPGIASQYVRFLDQSVRDQGANCVDASVMMASIFRRIGLRPVLFFQPGHCFVAVYNAAQGGQLIPIETTMLGSSPFTAALNYGGRELASATANLNSPGYAAVDIASARQAGVKPIEYEATP